MASEVGRAALHSGRKTGEESSPGGRSPGQQAGRGVWPGPTPGLTWRKVAGLRVTGLCVCRLPRLQAPAAAGWPNGTGDLPCPRAGAAAPGALGPVGEKTEGCARGVSPAGAGGEEGAHRKGVRVGGGGDRKVPDNAPQTPEWAHMQPPARHPRDQDWAAGVGGRGEYSLDPRRLRARPGP